MIKILVLPTTGGFDPNASSTDEALRGIPLPELIEFVEEAKGLGEDLSATKITVHGKDIRATYLTSVPSRRGLGNNR